MNEHSFNKIICHPHDGFGFRGLFGTAPGRNKKKFGENSDGPLSNVTLEIVMKACMPGVKSQFGRLVKVMSVKSGEAPLLKVLHGWVT